MRERAFRLARHDLAMFLQDHEKELEHIFREEMQRLDDEIPEENFFIDVKMVPMGEMILKAVLRAMNRFLIGDVDLITTPADIAEQAADDKAADTEAET